MAKKTKEERVKDWNNNFKKWNAFNDNLETFIVIGDTFEIRHELKSKGAKFSRELGWHFDHEEEGYKLEMISYKDVSKVLDDGRIVIDYENAPSVIEKIQEKYRVMIPCNSEWVGEIGGKYRGLATLKSVYSFQSVFGYTDIFTFEDENENIIVWMTEHGKNLNEGNHYSLMGNIKSHEIYKGKKQTKINRCKYTELM